MNSAMSIFQALLLTGPVLAVQIYISVCELVPTALKYDPHNHVTSKSMIIGMVVMAVSLLMFTI